MLTFQTLKHEQEK